MRRKREEHKNQDNSEQKSDEGKIYVKEPPKWDSAQIKSFKEKDIEILNYLDSIGEGIYDEGRTPGMYLKRHRGELPDRLKRKLATHERRKNSENEEGNSEELLRALFGNMEKSMDNNQT